MYSAALVNWIKIINKLREISPISFVSIKQNNILYIYIEDEDDDDNYGKTLTRPGRMYQK